MTTDFRSLCAKLVEAVEMLCGSGDSPARPGQRLILTTHVDGLEELAGEARKALAVSGEREHGQLVKSSEEELLACYAEGCWQEAKKMIMEECLPAPDSTATGKAFARRQHLAGLRAVLGAHGSPVNPNQGYNAALKAFAQYFRRNYPGPHTIIHKPDWHAPKIFRAAAHAIARHCGSVNQVPTTSFEQAWATLGYQYGEDALEGVRLGWELRGRFQVGPATGGSTHWPEAIRDRRPGPGDGDCDGCVQVLDKDGCWECCLLEDVDRGQPWLHTPRWVAQ